MPRPPAQPPQESQPPLVRYLSKCNVASRGQARELVQAGRVTVNGEVCTEGAVRVDPRHDRVEVDGTLVRLPDPRSLIWIAMNKPRGVVTTTSDPQGRTTVMGLLRKGHAPGLAPVGRLDQASGGLILLTNDSEVAARLLDPGSHLPKTYRVKVRGHPSPATLEGWRRTTREIDGLRLGPMGADVERSGPASTWLRITLLEGKNRQIRRRCAADGHAVEQLIRVAFGPVRLGHLEPGRSRRLTREEVQRLRSAARRVQPGRKNSRQGTGKAAPKRARRGPRSPGPSSPGPSSRGPSSRDPNRGPRS